jgi:hypothetical protein
MFMFMFQPSGKCSISKFPFPSYSAIVHTDRGGDIEEERDVERELEERKSEVCVSVNNTKAIQAVFLLFLPLQIQMTSLRP